MDTKTSNLPSRALCDRPDCGGGGQGVGWGGGSGEGVRIIKAFCPMGCSVLLHSLRAGRFLRNRRLECKPTLEMAEGGVGWGRRRGTLIMEKD